jgi:hypothetical protein
MHFVTKKLIKNKGSFVMEQTTNCMINFVKSKNNALEDAFTRCIKTINMVFRENMYKIS